MSLFKDYFKRHFHPLGIRIIGWNLLLLIIVKLILPQSAFQLASFINSIPAFDSREIIKFTNESRLASNLSPLQANAQLDLAASKKLNDMATEEYFAHISPTGVNPWFWIKQSQYQYRVAGENLALGFPTAKETVSAWLDSSSHRENVLNSQYTEIGVAVKAVEIDGNNGILVVQMFGSPIKTVSSVVKPTPTKSPTPVQVAVISPPVSPIVSSTTQTKGESIALYNQYVSTDETSAPIAEPIKIKYEDANNAEMVSKMVNSVFPAYALTIAFISTLALILFERNRSMALKMSLNIAIFIISIIIPATQITLEGLVF